jgi:DNA (cytosine-5)-methyltransferase 1
MERAGFDIRAAVELDRFAADTYRHNFPKTPFLEGDVRGFLKQGDLTARDFAGTDVVFGGPPCQGYSQIGTRDLGDKRNDLYREFARVVDTLRPRLFLMENVPNLVLFQRGHYRDLILRKLRSIGYANATFVHVRASDYGVPQHRNRVVFVGTRDEESFDYDLQQTAESILSSIQVKQPVTVWQAIGDLPARVVDSGDTLPYPKARRLTEYQKIMRLDCDSGSYTQKSKRRRGIGDAPHALHNHHTKEIQERRLHLISLLAPGQKANSLPKSIWDGKRPEKWRRLHPDMPAYTILANMHRDLSEFVHPKEQRWITVREAARLQSFHDGFVFVGSEWQQLKQIGNAVPPLLAEALGTLAGRILQLMDGESIEVGGLQATLPLAEAVV